MAAEAQARIDEEISNLRTRRNTFSLISRLPTETLATIFIHGARDYHRDSDRGYFTRTAPSWVNVSYVCRHWRGVALNCPSLWTYVFMTSQRCTEELLARSKRASLMLHVKLGFREKSPRVSRFVEQVTNHTERIQELSLRLPATHTLDVLSKLSSRAPRLKNLTIDFILVRRDPSERSFVLFSGDTPALRTLELTHCPVPLHSFKLIGLTTLSLHRVPVRFQQNMVEFLATLSCMPHLKRLYLKDALASAAGFLSSSAFNTSKKIDLPHLSRLLTAAPLSTVIALLARVNIPLKTEVRLKCKSEHDSSPVDYYGQLSSLLVQRFSTSEDQALSSPTIRSLVIESAMRREVKLTFSASERDRDSFDFISESDWGCNIPLKIVVDSGPSRMTSDGDHIISDICCSIPLTNVQSLHVIDPLFPPGFWRKMLGHLQDLRYLELSNGGMPDLASVLSVTDLIAHEGVENLDGHASSDRDRDHMLVSRLEELELYKITFSTRDPQDCLFDALSTRNTPQGRVTMIQCNIDGSKLLDDMVRSWDGVEIPVACR
jgi:hypothetical protein